MSSLTPDEKAWRVTPRVSATTPRDGAAARAAGSKRHAWGILNYRYYPTFTWDWSWRRCILFSTFGILIGIWSGITVGAIVNRHIGFTQGLGAAITNIVAMCVGPLAASWVRNRKWPMGRQMTGVIAAVILGVAAADAWSQLGNPYINRLLLSPASQAQAAAFFGRFHAADSSPLGLLGKNVIFLLLSGVLALPSYRAEQRRLIEQARERELGALQLQMQETDLRLLVLQAQIEPHFLFNTLASLRSLLRQDVERAEAMIDALVEHLRAAMPVFRENRQYSTLSEQLRICTSYLELMRVRLGDRLTYTIDAPEALRSATFPPLILLTLVENAVKHGIEPKPGAGLIRIEATREQRADGAHIRVIVVDNGAGLSTGLGHGVGLSNIRAQLALKYGDHAALTLMSGEGGGAVATLDIPDSPAS